MDVSDMYNYGNAITLHCACMAEKFWRNEAAHGVVFQKQKTI